MLQEPSLGWKLTRLRGTRSQREVAEAVSISPAYLCKLERDQRRNPGPRTLERIAGYYGVLVEYLEGNMAVYLQAFCRQAFLPGQSFRERLQLLVGELGVRYGVTAAELAEALHLLPSDLDRYLQGEANPPHGLAQALERLTGVPADELYYGPRDLTAYQDPVELAARVGLTPEELKALIRAWAKGGR